MRLTRHDGGDGAGARKVFKMVTLSKSESRSSRVFAGTSIWVEGFEGELRRKAQSWW